jgi:hypothetical protein
LSAYLLPDPVFSRTAIGRRLSVPALAHGDRSDPAFSKPRLTVGRALPHRFGLLVVSRFQTNREVRADDR